MKKNTFDLAQFAADWSQFYQQFSGNTPQAQEKILDHIAQFLPISPQLNVQKIPLPAAEEIRQRQVSCGQFTLLNPRPECSWASPATMAANSRHWLRLLPSSGALPAPSVNARILTEADYLFGADATGALIVLNRETFPSPKVLQSIQDRKGIGFISDFSTGFTVPGTSIPDLPIDLTPWNFSTPIASSVLTGFSVTPQLGEQIRALARQIPLMAEVKSNGKWCSGASPMLTAQCQGDGSEEIWIIIPLASSFYRPNSAGLATALYCAHQQCRLTTGTTLKFVFTPPDTAAYLKDNFIESASIRGAIVLNAGNLTRPSPLEITTSYAPFCGNRNLPELLRKSSLGEFNPCGEKSAWAITLETGHPAIPTLEITAVLPGKPPQSSAGQAPESLKKLAVKFNQLIGQLRTAKNLSGRPATSGWQKSSIQDQRQATSASQTFTRPPQDCQLTKWQLYARNLTINPLRGGFPLAEIERIIPRALPGNRALRRNLIDLLLYADGQTNVVEQLDAITANAPQPLSDSDYKKIVTALGKLADANAVNLHNPETIREEEIVAALRQLGISRGDLLLCHTSLTACGLISHPEATIYRALRTAVGESGTLLFPTFNACWISSDNRPNHNWGFRPAATGDFSSVGWTGAMPVWFLKNFPTAPRGEQLTHPWAGWGPLAKACVQDHSREDTPGSVNSPLGKAVEYGGKILHFGNEISSTTFLHHIEDVLELPCSGEAVCQYRATDGTLHCATIPKFPSGGRNWYKDPEHCRFFTEMQKHGLVIHRARLGIGELKLFDAKELFRIGIDLCRQDYTVIC